MFGWTLQFDRVSFWLGFLAATLLWWFFQRIRPWIPQIRAQLRQTIRTISQRNLTGVELYLRRETLRRALHQHLAAPLFTLDDILIPPTVRIPPNLQDPTGLPTPQTIAGQVLPYLPEWPELTAAFGAPSMPLLQALQSGRYLVLVGHPGAGKTVAISALAAQIARKDPAGGDYADAVPLLLHIAELDVTLAEGVDPLQNLVRAISTHASVVMQPQVPRYLRNVLEDPSQHVVLLLDGLDELAAQPLTAAVAYLKALTASQPRLQVITTASPDALDGLTDIDFFPLTLIAWTLTQRQAFAHQWGECWSKQLIPELKKQGSAYEVDPLLVHHWLVGEPADTSPLEWTLRVWGAFAGDLTGSSTLNIYQSGLLRYLPSPSALEALETLAYQMLQQQAASLPFGEMEKILSGSTAAQPNELFDAGAIALQNAPEHVTQPANAGKSRKGARRDAFTSRGEQIINELLNGGILVDHGSQISFASPALLGFLAGLQLPAEEAEHLCQIAAQEPVWSVAETALHYAVTCYDHPRWMAVLVDNPAAPLYRNLLIPARWLRDAPPSAEWRTDVMRWLVTFLQRESLPFSIRARFIAAFALSRDPSTIKLYKQLLGSKSAGARRLALLGCGASAQAQLMPDILSMLADPVSAVRCTACLALAAIPGQESLKALVELLLNGDEELRQAAAESLAHLLPDGQKVLEEAAGLEDILTRRAAVFGLLQVREPWAQAILEKMAIEDSQWVVRNAAAQALETLHEHTSLVPGKLTQPSDTGWLITFASKLGMGILPGQPAQDVLLMVLKSGSVEEQIAALAYLRDHTGDTVISAIYDLLYGEQEELQDMAVYTLWWMAASGKKLPAPARFNLQEFA